MLVRSATHDSRPLRFDWLLLKLALDGIFSFSYVPLRIATIIGTILSGCGLLYAGVIIFQRMKGQLANEELAGWPTVVVSVLVLGGVQLIILGIIGEYIGRIFEELKGKYPQLKGLLKSPRDVDDLTPGLAARIVWGARQTPEMGEKAVSNLVGDLRDRILWWTSKAEWLEKHPEAYETSATKEQS